MASTQAVRVWSVSQAPTPLRWVEKYFYFLMSLLVAAVVGYGFSRTVGPNLIHAAPPRPILLWVHAASFSSWVVFYILQSAMVRAREVRIHRRLGWAGAVLGAAMVVVGFWVPVVMAHFQVSHLHRNMDDAYAFLTIPFLDMTAFATCLGLAILWRNKPERHRRLMLIATCALTAAAFGRIPALHSVPPLYFYTGVDGLIVLGTLRDFAISRRIHRVYLVALPLLLAGQVTAVQMYLHRAAFWLRITHALLG